MDVSSPVYLTGKHIKTAHSRIKSCYDVVDLKLNITYPASVISQAEPRDLIDILYPYDPAVRLILAGSRWDMSEEKIVIHLVANGKDKLDPLLVHLREHLKKLFGICPEIEIDAHSVEGEALYEETEKLRLEAVKNMPLPTFRQEKESKAAAPMENPELIFGRPFTGDSIPMSDVTLDTSRVIVEGEVFAVNHRELKKRNAWIVSFDITDYTGSVRINMFMEADKAAPVLDKIKKPGGWLRIQGTMNFDRFENENVLRPQSIMVGKKRKRVDNAPEKRVELHLHTKMSNMDALTDVGKVVAQAIEWGHKAIAITDHGVAQAFPDALKAADKKDIKIIYGCEAYFVNDVDESLVVHGQREMPLTDEFVTFWLQTTGQNKETDTILEVGAAIYCCGEMIKQFSSFVQPVCPLSPEMLELFGLTEDMLRDAPTIGAVLQDFMAFCGDRPLVTHDADVDIGFLLAACKAEHIEYQPVYVDTLVLAQEMQPGMKSHKLNVLADALNLTRTASLRAADSAVTVGHLFHHFLAKLEERGVTALEQIDPAIVQLRSAVPPTDRHAYHMILFAKNQTGLRNLYRLISYAHLNYLKRVPRIPKSELVKWREGLIVGSACEASDLFQAILAHKSHDELLRIASFYDFLEIQPLANNRFMLADGLAKDDEELKEFNRTIIRLARELDKPVVATGDVHFQNPEDEIYRRMLLASKGFKDCDRENPLYFRTTEEMLAEFDYLGEELAHEVVITNPNLIADMCEKIRPVPLKLFAPAIENSVEDLNRLVYGRMKELYGDEPHPLIVKRVETEMHDIISCHYDVIYMSAQKLVQNSLENGYLVGSRGSVGSSIVAYLSGITEVNSFPPHYRCPACKYHTFDVPEGYACGADLPDDVCPRCGEKFAKEGFAIPFETFLGFGGDKVPDIDLNFSGEYQAKAHAYCVEMFGASQVFRAGTIGTVAEKTAYGYAKKYLDERNITVSKAEENRLATGCVKVKRTTGQHPGGLVVIPRENEIWDFCPVQHPADDTSSETITTHFEYHSMEANLLKLDMLGHDDPTMIRMLEDLTGVNAREIPLDDKDTMSIFKSSKVLGFEDDPILGPMGSCGIPEFGTGFTRGMLMDTMPDRFDTLVRLSGFSHGTDVWLGNAKDLIVSGTASVSQAIGCRDDIMNYLISKGMPEQRSFKIMESVRKGRGLPPGAEEEMVEAGVPDWYIGSCKKIKYLFPKAHAVAYVMMAFRIAWFKVHRPLAFYAAYFYRRSQKDGFDAAMMTRGMDTVKEEIRKMHANPDKTDKEDDLLTTLELCYEFYLRGFSFERINIYESDALRFLVKGDKLIPPFVSVSGLGEAAALDIVEGRKGKHFISIEEFSAACPKVSKTHIENLRAAGAFGDLPDTSQVTLF
ncbi:MAG: PolC-type DNA polymerase III [Oscillospiraceae bacterium]|nr:PolC-type DNA polymerase III [Oscillospiraceae bacterium]